MRRQNGQAAVEFALTFPFIVILILGMIYGGVMFMDYLNYNNQARTIAREISVATPSRRTEIKNYYDGTISSFYEVTRNVNYDSSDVVVKIEFKRDETLPIINFPPKELTIEYRMALEDTQDPQEE